MRAYLLPLLLVALAAGCATRDVPAANDSVDNGASLSADLGADLATIEGKLVDLAQAIPADKYDWRPGAGVRSVREVLLHLASDNYLLPAIIGFTPDPATGIVANDYTTASAFEKRPLEKDSVVAEVARSFAFAKQSVASTTAERMRDSVSMFGQPFTGQSAWILAVTHLHEHLGQLIAYARMNGVKPPWSQ